LLPISFIDLHNTKFEMFLKFNYNHIILVV